MLGLFRRIRKNRHKKQGNDEQTGQARKKSSANSKHTPASHRELNAGDPSGDPLITSFSSVSKSRHVGNIAFSFLPSPSHLRDKRKVWERRSPPPSEAHEAGSPRKFDKPNYCMSTYYYSRATVPRRRQARQASLVAKPFAIIPRIPS